MKSSIYMITFIIFIQSGMAHPPEWVLYNHANTGLDPDNSMGVLAVDHEDRKWLSDGKGLHCFDDPYWAYYSISPAGLSEGAFITSLEIDTSGGKWIGTTDYYYGTGGLIYANSGQWTVYNTGNSGLPSNQISCLDLSATGILWIGTHDKGLVRFDGTNWVVYDSLNSGLPLNRIQKIETTPSGEVWVITAYNDLVHFDGTIWTTYTSSNTGIPGNKVQSMTVDENGTAWFGMSYSVNYIPHYGLARFDGTSWYWYTHDLIDYKIISMATDSLNNLWLIRKYYGVIRFDGTDWSEEYGISNAGLLTIDNQGLLWVATTSFGGGWHFDCKILSYDGLTWTYYDDHNTGLPSNRIKCLASQNENVVIGSDAQGDPVGGVGGGLTFFNGSGWATSNWSNSGRITEILCMATENDGTTWMGALQQLPFWSGLIKFNGDTAIYYDPTNSGLPSGYIFDIEIDTAGRKWIATGDKVALFDDTSWQIMEFDHYYVFAIERSPEGEMWFAGDGIITFDGVNWLTFDHTITGTDMNITSIAFAPDGAVLFGNNLYSNPSNIIRFDGNTWQIYTPDNSGLPTTNITGLASESSGVLWIATGDKGAVRFDGTSWTAYNTANSYLPSDAISCLLIDAYDNKWFGFLGWESYNSPAIAIFNENGVFTQKPVTEPTPSPSLLLYPNPFTSQVTLEMELRESPEASIQILSADGRVVKMITGEAEFGGHMHKVIDGAELPPGLYFVIVQTSNQISRGKVLKI